MDEEDSRGAQGIRYGRRRHDVFAAQRRCSKELQLPSIQTLEERVAQKNPVHSDQGRKNQSLPAVRGQAGIEGIDLCRRVQVMISRWKQPLSVRTHEYRSLP